MREFELNKKKMIVFALLGVLSALCLWVSFRGVSVLYFCSTGWALDYISVNPELETHFTASFFAALVSLCLMLLCLASKKARRLSIILIAVAFCAAAAISTVYSIGQTSYLESELERMEAIRPSDWSSNEMIMEISLDDFERCVSGDAYSGELYPVYICRSDCKECVRFEKELDPILVKHCERVWAYNTTFDRDGSKSSRMRDALDSCGVDSVPCLLVFGLRGVEAKWTSVSGNKEAIERFFDDGTLVD